MIKGAIYSKLLLDTKIVVGCEFCEIFSDKNPTKVLDLEYGALFLNYNQSFTGRCLYIPFDHYTNLNQITSENFMLYNNEIQFVAIKIQETFNSEIINIAMLCNKVRHIHWHLIPRYKSDKNWGNPPWPNEPVEILPERLEYLKEKLLRSFL